MISVCVCVQNVETLFKFREYFYELPDYTS